MKKRKVTEMQVFCPWTDKEVKVLKRRFNKDLLHYACEECKTELIPTEFGLICPNQYCDFMQSWVDENDLKED